MAWSELRAGAPEERPWRGAASATVELHGVRFQNLSERACVEEVVARSAAGQGGWLVTPNLDILRQCAESREIRALCAGADLVVADGMPLIWASRLQGTPLKERVCGANLVSSLPEAAARRGLSIYLLGGEGDAAVSAAEVLRRRHPHLSVRGVHSPPFGFEQDKSEIARMYDTVARAAPDIVFVALSFPKGEWLVQRLRPCQPRAWWVGVGVAFSFLGGRIPRAPAWMQAGGLEWMYRLYCEPRRLFRRYVVHDIPFAARLFTRAALRRMHPDAP
jgi:N-acetylglucosaminyldiphosphoundecaprenol N-acetyl-beta-D-mannosaminyltransferase